MVDTTPPQFDSRTAEQLRRLTAHALQLLTMMEVVQVSMAQDAAYLADATAAMEAFVVHARDMALPVPLDPDGRYRESLQTSIDKAQMLHRSSVHMVGQSAGELSAVHELIARSLNRLVSVCQRLLEAVQQHEQSFEQGQARRPRTSAA